MQQDACLSDERYATVSAALFDQMEEAVIGCDLSARIVYVNAGAERLLGYSKEQLRDRPLWQLTPQTTSTALQRKFQRLLEEGRAQRFDLYFAQAHRWLSGSLYRVENRVYCLARDISLEREASLRLGLLTDVSRAFDEAGPKLADTLESIARTVAEVIGGGCFIYLAADERLVVRSEGGSALASQRRRERFTDIGRRVVQSQACLAIPEGAQAELGESYAAVPVRLSQTVIAALGVWYSGQGFGAESDFDLLAELAACAALSLTKSCLWEESRQAQELAQQERTRLELALQATDTGIFDYDPRRGALYWDPRCRDLFGIPNNGSSQAGADDVFQWIVAEDRERVRQCLEDALDPAKGDICSVEFRVRRSPVRWLAVHGRALDAGLPARRVIGTLHDITERKRIEAAREQQVDELTRTVRFSELFVGVLGHDLRSPLTAINTSAALLARRAPTEMIAKTAQRILGSSERMRRMVDQLLDFTRIRLGEGLPIERAPTDMAVLLRTTVDELAAADPKVFILQVLGSCTGSWDPDRLWQLIANLGTNALQHREPNSKVVLRLDGTRQEEVVLEVRNNGVIPSELLPTLFEPMRGRRNAGSQGLGLGLFISAQIAKAHGGRIQVRSNAVTGTCFQVFLPRH